MLKLTCLHPQLAIKCDHLIYLIAFVGLRPAKLSSILPGTNLLFFLPPILIKSFGSPKPT